MGQKQLVDEFAKGLSQARKYEDVAHLFVSVDDFTALVDTLRKADLPESYRRQIEGPDNLKKQQELLRQIDKRLVEQWQDLVQQIRQRQVQLVFENYDARTKSNSNNVSFVEFSLAFDVHEGGKQRKVKRVIRAMDLGGKLKIVHIFRDL